MLKSKRVVLVTILLVVFIALDLLYAVTAFFFPKLWYTVIHGAAYVDPEGLLQRTGAIWAAFAVVQLVALLRWQRQAFWLAVVAGLRLSELFADWTYLYFAQDISGFGRIALLVSTPVNLLISLFLLKAFFWEEEARRPTSSGYRSQHGKGARFEGVLNRMQEETFNQLVDAIIPPPDQRKVSPQKLTDRFEEFIAASDDIPKEAIRTALDIMAAPLELAVAEADGEPRAALRARIREALNGDDQVARNAARLLHVMVSYLYYSDRNVDEQVGYTRFVNRDRPEAREAKGTRRLRVHQAPPPKEYDVCIVGSGVAGGLLANRLARKGKSVLLLDAGRYYPEGELSDDEFLMLAQLYKADVFQAALTGFPVIQAKCVGGGAVVNNAVCFRMPDWVKKTWDNFGAELDAARLKAAFDRTRDEFKIRPADEVVRHNGRLYLNPTREFFRRGAETLGIPTGTGDPDQVKFGFHTVAVNLEDCLGCGYCNLGCQYERKVNTLQMLLPEAVATGNCDIVEQAWVDSVATDFLGFGHLRANGLRVRFQNGEEKIVKARKYVLSAGAIASSEILLKSFKIRLLGTPIGERFSANAGSPLQAYFGDKVEAFDGLQITDYFLEENAQGAWDWIAETWFNPPGTQAQAIPAFLDDHFRRMQKYAHLAAVGILVGSEPVGKINLNVFNRAGVDFTLTEADLKRLNQGMRRCAEVYLAAGAEEVIMLTWNPMSLKNKSDLDRITREIGKPDDYMVISTGHPQGGNPMSDDKVNGRHVGVVGTDFKVHGVEDLFVCDASVFPTSVAVNPQWTIIALADLCAEEILAEL